MSLQEQNDLLRLLIEQVDYDGPASEIQLQLHLDGIQALMTRTGTPHDRFAPHAPPQVPHLHRSHGPPRGPRHSPTRPTPGHPTAALIPRISRLMALALRFEQLIRNGTVHNQADLARLAHISQARVTQIMDLLLLAPEIQEEIVFLEPVEWGKDRITERQMRRITAKSSWLVQSDLWGSLPKRCQRLLS